MKIDYFQKKGKRKRKYYKRDRIPHLADRAEATKTVHIIQPHLNLSVYHSTSNSYHKTANKKKKLNVSESPKLNKFQKKADQ